MRNAVAPADVVKSRPAKWSVSLVTTALICVLLGSDGAAAVTPRADIASTGPLTHVYVGNDLACQVGYAGDGRLQFYPSLSIPGDCGTFLVTGGTLYAPDFASHGATATTLLGARTPFVPVSQSAVSGSGTAGDPFAVATVVDAGTSGLRIAESDRYAIGATSYRTTVTISNSGATDASAILFRAGDCYLGGSDDGYGFVTPTDLGTAVGCSKTANNSPPDRVEQWIPLTGGNRYYEAACCGDVWKQIGTKTSLPNTCRCTEILDNGAAISWDLVIPAGGSVSVHHLTNFGRAAIATVTKARRAVADLVPNSEISFPFLTAELVDASSVPLAGKSIEFYDGTTLLCTGQTGADGVARCDDILAEIPVTLARGFTAVFAGDSSYLASVGAARVLRVSEMDLV